MRRLLFVDDNIRTFDGHYIELATLLCQGAEQLGFVTELATHAEFHQTPGSQVRWSSAFTTPRMLGWSLGVDGLSRVRRDADGRPCGDSSWRNTLQRMYDQCVPLDRRPQNLIEKWSHELSNWLSQVQANRDDRLVLNTSDDFQLLGLTKALLVLGDATPRNVHLIFHFAIIDDQTDPDRPRQLGIQVGRALKDLAAQHPSPPEMHLHATTAPLRDQLRSVGINATLIPYPTRFRRPVAYSDSDPAQALNLLLGGWPRREKGTKSIARLLSSIEHPLLRQRRYRISMQAMLKKWRKIVPSTLHPDCRLCSNLVATLDPVATRHLLNIITSSISPQDYQSWLDTADVGLFLYDPRRYVARCSSVLLEFMIRGIPVIVPDRSWLADQVREAGAIANIGDIYQSVDDIPKILEAIADDYASLRHGSRQYAGVIAKRHHPTATLVSMGIRPAKLSTIAA